VINKLNILFKIKHALRIFYNFNNKRRILTLLDFKFYFAFIPLLPYTVCYNLRPGHAAGGAVG
jgi:ATP adenylyltransferase/5',5'''-P-1,P-4-tetraphosphate phosphorylase II